MRGKQMRRRYLFGERDGGGESELVDGGAVVSSRVQLRDQRTHSLFGRVTDSLDALQIRRDQP